MPRILATGFSGPIGAALLPSLSGRGYQVVRLVHSLASGNEQIRWDPAQPLSPPSASGFEAVIHLAGEAIAGRWTPAKKRAIRDSRVLGTQHLVEALVQAPEKPRLLIAASAIGYYGSRADEVLREDSAPGQSFLSEVCKEWEAATQAAEKAGIRTVNVRFGIVLSSTGGALSKMLTPFRLGLGGNMGDGRQWWSWIAVDDIVGAVHHIMKTDLLRGPVNLVAPKPVANAEFTRTLARALHRPAIFPMPAFAARLAFGEMADELLLGSQRVEPTKLVTSGYSFHYTNLRIALEDILDRR